MAAELKVFETVDVDAFKGAMGAVPSPVSIVTCYDDGKPQGTTVGAFMSLSLAPSMVLISLQKTSTLLPVLQRTERFGLNVLCSEQTEIAKQFSKRGIDRWAGVEWDLVEDVPRIAGNASFVACSVFQLMWSGDHVVITGMVHHAESAMKPGLVYQHREFGHFVGETSAIV